MNKKAVVFTFIVVILISIILIAFLTNLNTRTQSKIQTLNIKVETLNTFVRNLEKNYLPAALGSSSNQAIISLLDYESNQTEALGTPTYIADVNDYLKQVIETGEYNEEQQEDMIFKDGPIISDYELGTTLSEINKLALQQGIKFNHEDIDYNTLKITQEDPWHVKVSFLLTYYVKDQKEEVAWNFLNKEISVLLDIKDYRDPLYLIQPELGKKSVSVIKTPYAGFDINNFTSHVNNIYFRNNQKAPSFLDRLQGNLNIQGINGIETLVDPSYYPNPNGFSNADYQFITGILGVCVKGMPDNFKLDSDAANIGHLEYYNREQC